MGLDGLPCVLSLSGGPATLVGRPEQVPFRIGPWAAATDTAVGRRSWAQRDKTGLPCRHTPHNPKNETQENPLAQPPRLLQAPRDRRAAAGERDPLQALPD